MFPVAGRLAVALQLASQRTYLGAEAADLFRDPGDIARVELDLRPPQRGADATAMPFPGRGQRHPAGDPGEGRATGHERQLRLTRDLADGLARAADG
jgi:hypothetical protein